MGFLGVVFHWDGQMIIFCDFSKSSTREMLVKVICNLKYG